MGADGLRRPCRGTRREALRRPAPAHRHRPGAPQGRADPGARRGDRRARLEVEAAIQDSLYRLMVGKTVIAIAHRLSTIAAIDRLVVMEEGRVVETGRTMSCCALAVSTRRCGSISRAVSSVSMTAPRRNSDMAVCEPRHSGEGRGPLRPAAGPRKPGICALTRSAISRWTGQRSRTDVRYLRKSG